MGALLVLGIALLGTVGGAIGGAREIAGLFDGSTEPPAAVEFSPSELKPAKNGRYGFSFQYPATWTRQDPINGEG